MADNFGPSQPFSYEAKDHSWDSVVFSRSIPPKSPDWNLIGQIPSNKDQLSQSIPSGWYQVGPTVLAATGSEATVESSAIDGQVVTSEGYLADSFKLISKGALRALVNGWALDIRGTDSLDNNNLITMESMESVNHGRADFVFLEVWRELITKSSVVYKYGNVDASEITNDLTTADRVQVKYRIRTASNVTLEDDGFGPGVYASGALPLGIYTSYTFSNQASSGDAGLWRAGDGSLAAQTALGTVDGFVYAIPMFAVYRRGLSAGFQPNAYDTSASLNGSGKKSDRPDGCYVNAVYPDDIVDLRHRSTAGKDLTALMEKTWYSLINGSLKTRRGLARGNSGYIEAPGGQLLTKGEEFGGNFTGLPQIGSMQSSGVAVCRTLCAAEVLTRNNVVQYYPGSAWAVGTYYVYMGNVDISLPEGAYTATTGTVMVTDVDVSYNRSSSPGLSIHDWLYIDVLPGSALISSTEPLKIQLPITYPASQSGLLDVPEELLEIRKTSTDPDIQRAFPAVDGGLIPAHGDGSTSDDYIENRGAEASSTWDQGINVVYHTTMASVPSTSITLVDGMAHSHEVVGIKGVQRKQLSGEYGPWESFGVSRTVVPAGIEYVLTGVTTTGGSSQDIRVTFQSKTKFFEASRQGRGIIETYEVKEVAPLYIGGVFYVDTGSQPLLAICQAAGLSGEGLPYAYVNGEKRLLVTTTDGGVPLANFLPVVGSFNYTAGKYLPTRVKIVFQGTTPSNLDTITVPVIVNSSVSLSESYTVYYKTSGYQGTSSSVGKRGTLLAKTQHLVTTNGSGTMADYSFTGTARFGMVADKTIVNAETGTSWDNDVLQAGDYIYKSSRPSERYRIASVPSSTQLVLQDPYFGTSESVSFAVVRKDVPASGSFCVVDRLPSVTSMSGMASNAAIGSIGSTTVAGLASSATAEPLASSDSDVSVGNVGQVYHGRTGLLLSISGSGTYQRPEQYPDVCYGPVAGATQDTRLYQGYLFSEDGTGRLYLAVQAAENPPNNDLVRFTGSKGIDSVDVFELLGRPLTGRG